MAQEGSKGMLTVKLGPNREQEVVVSHGGEELRIIVERRDAGRQIRIHLEGPESFVIHQEPPRQPNTT